MKEILIRIFLVVMLLVASGSARYWLMGASRGRLPATLVNRAGSGQVT